MKQTNTQEKPSLVARLLQVLRYIILAALIAAALLFATVLISAYFDRLADIEQGISLDGFALGYAIFLIFAVITYGALFLLSLFGLLFSLFYKKLTDPKRNKIWFLSLMGGCALSLALYFLVGIFSGLF